MCDFIWLINWEANQRNYLAVSKFEIQILSNQINWFVMIYPHIILTHDTCLDKMIWYDLSQFRQHYLLILERIPAILCEDILQHHINQNREKEGKRIKSEYADQISRAWNAIFGYSGQNFLSWQNWCMTTKAYR